MLGREEKRPETNEGKLVKRRWKRGSRFGNPLGRDQFLFMIRREKPIRGHTIMAMRILRFALPSFMAFIILFLGCQHAAIAYRLRREGLDPVLLPPTAGNHTSESDSIAVKQARQENANTADCDIAGELISLHWGNSTAYISFHSRAFLASDNQSPDQVGRGTYDDPFLALAKFRSDLTERQSKGCLSPIQSDRLRRAIVENLPLPPAIAYSLELGSYDVTGFIDLTPDFWGQL